MYRVDLHTHSAASPDGGLAAENYERVLASGKLQVAAVTDHNRIDFAVELQQKLGDSIIVGEEVAALEGEVIGLYLHETMPQSLPARETSQHIRAHGCLVYIPHSFETARKGLPLAALNQIANLFDVIETYNGRTLQNRGGRAAAWAAEHKVPQASGSDAHGP